MAESMINAAPEWVYKRDGRLVPFESDKISRALFAAGESLGQADAFTARELTDGVLHFLGPEADGALLTTAQIAELVIKVVRELGHPGLAQAFAEFAQRQPQGPQAKVDRRRLSLEMPDLSLIAPATLEPMTRLRRAGGACLKAYALEEVFSRDLAAAHRDGLLVLGGLEAPFELAGWLLGAPTGHRIVEAVEQARALAGEYLAIDGPEYVLCTPHNRPGGEGAASANGADEYARELGIGLRTTGLRAIVNLNGASPPFWAGDLADGPLFAQQRQPTSQEMRGGMAERLLTRLLDVNELRIDWHLDEHDLADASEERLRRLARLAMEHEALTFVFDRPRRASALAEGIDRQHPAVLMTAGLNLARLQEQLGQRSTPAGNPAEVFLQKLGSLARLALSAGVQKRAFLRRHERNWPAFLLDRARLVVTPLGLETVVRRLPSDGLGERIVERLHEVLDHDGRACHLDVCLDTLPVEVAAVPGTRPQAALQSASNQRTISVSLPEGRWPALDEVVDWLRWTGRQSEIARLRFVRGAEARTQTLAPWAR